MLSNKRRTRNNADVKSQADSLKNIAEDTQAEVSVKTRSLRKRGIRNCAVPDQQAESLPVKKQTKTEENQETVRTTRRRKGDLSETKTIEEVKNMENRETIRTTKRRKGDLLERKVIEEVKTMASLRSSKTECINKDEQKNSSIKKSETVSSGKRRGRSANKKLDDERELIPDSEVSEPRAKHSRKVKISLNETQVQNYY